MGKALTFLSKVTTVMACSAVDNFFVDDYSTHHVGEIWCTPKLEGALVWLSCEKLNNSYDCISIAHRGTYFLLIYRYCGK